MVEAASRNLDRSEICNRREVFSFDDETEEFDKAFVKMLEDNFRQLRNDVFPPENALSYSHGERWLSGAGSNSGEPSEEQHLEEHSAEIEVRFEDIVDHNVAIVPRILGSIAEGMHRQFMQTMFKTIGDACERSGNVVNAKEMGSAAAAFLEMLRKIEFGVDRQGKPTRPTMHLGNEAFEKLREDAESQGQRFREEVERITAEKEQSALEREAQRQKRFKKPQ